MKSLYEITTSYAQLMDKLLEQEGEMTPEDEERLAITEQEMHVKSENYVKIIKTFDAEVKMIDEEIKRLQNLKKTRQNAIKRLKNALSDAMRTFGISKIKTGLFTLSFRKSEAVVISVSPEELPKDCQVIKVEPISKSDLKQRIKAGEDIPGVEIIVNENLQIR